MAEENNKKSASERNIHAKNQIKETNINMDNDKEYATGASAFAHFFNSLVSEVEEKAKKEADKPRYRFLESINETKVKREENELHDVSGILYSQEFINTISELQENLDKYKYSVEIIENLDCKDVTNESRYFIRICNYNGVYVDIDLFEYEQNIKDFEFNEQDYIENKISKIVGSCNKRTKLIANCIVDYLAHIIYFKELYTLTYKKIGWDTYNWDFRGWIFKYDKIYTYLPLVKGKCKGSYTEGLDMCCEDEVKRFEWVEDTTNLINNHEYCGLILGAGISGLVRQLLPYTKENNININIQGKTGSGKSTICHYLLGIFGNPEKLEGSFTDTTNSMEEIRVKRPILPYVLDERMLKIENETEKAKKQIILMDIFREYEGKVKERLGKQYEEISGERTYGPIISSSVRSMIEYIFQSDDLGQYRRFIEFNIGGREEKYLFSSQEEAEYYESQAYKNYGFGIRVIVDYMLHLLDCGNNTEHAVIFENRFNKLEGEISKRLEDEQNDEIKGLTTSSKRFSLIVLSYQILRESLLYYLYGLDEDKSNYADFTEYANDEKIVKDKSHNIIELLVQNLILKTKKIVLLQNPKDDKVIYDYVLSHEKYFKKIDTWNPEAGKLLFDDDSRLLGVYVLDSEKMTLYTYKKYQLDMFWYADVIPEPSTILEFINEVRKNNLDQKGAVKLAEDKKYGAVTYRAQGDNCRTSKKYPGMPTVYFSYKEILINRPVVKEDELKEGES